MGVTINFKGQLNSKSDYDEILKVAQEYADKHEMPYSFFEEENKLLLRVKDEKDWDYLGLTRGIRIQPHINSDPLNLEFDKDYIIQEYCKTQFAGIETHIKVIEILKLIEPNFDWLDVNDEGEYWETNNSEITQNHIDKCFELIEKEKQEKKNLSGPYRVADGRIVDLMEN
jgi:hypothetical protein